MTGSHTFVTNGLLWTYVGKFNLFAHRSKDLLEMMSWRTICRSPSPAAGMVTKR